MNWECPNCDAWLTAPTNRMHYCPGLAGLSTYFVPVGTKVKVETVEREDYVGQESVQLDGNNKPNNTDALKQIHADLQSIVLISQKPVVKSVHRGNGGLIGTITEAR